MLMYVNLRGGVILVRFLVIALDLNQIMGAWIEAGVLKDLHRGEVMLAG